MQGILQDLKLFSSILEILFRDFNRTCNLKIYDLTTRCFKIALGVSMIKAKLVFFVDAHKKLAKFAGE